MVKGFIMPDWDHFDRMMNEGMKKLDRAMEGMDTKADKLFSKSESTFDKMMEEIDGRIRKTRKVKVQTHMMDKLKTIGFIIKGFVATFILAILIMLWAMFTSYQTEKEHKPKDLNPPAVEESQPESKPGSMKKL